jgi:glycine reductase complex component B subunit gamma
MDTVRVVCYVNQFFGQLGGEEKAGAEPDVLEGPVGAARAVQHALEDGGRVVATVRCGDNYVAEEHDTTIDRLLSLVAAQKPHLFVAGPAFQAGRYGVGCGALCAAVQSRLGVPAVTGMHEENPGVDLYRRQVYILRTGGDTARMLDEVRRMVALGLKLVRREPIGGPAAEGYFARGLTHNALTETSAAERATAMLLEKLSGRPITSEVPRPAFTPVRAPARVPDMRRAVIALVTDGGLVPRGNPDGIESLAATRYGAYEITGLTGLDPNQYDNVHRGYDTTYVKQDPHRLVPVDVARELEKAGAVGKLHDVVYSTTGVATTLAHSQRMGREIAAKLKAAGVTGVILTST